MELTREQREILAVKIRLSPFWNRLEKYRDDWIWYVQTCPLLQADIDWLAEHPKIRL